MARMLIILNPGAEEIETVTVGDVWVRAGQEVIVASSAATTVVTGSRGLPLAAHCLLDEVINDDFDVVYLPGGLGSAEVNRDDARIQALMARRLAAKQTLAVICASPISLIPQKLCAGRTLTSHPGVRAQVEPHAKAWLDEPVVVDGALITSQGPATALALGLHLATMFAGPSVAEQVARAMLVPV